MAAMQLADPPMTSPGGDAVDLPQRVEPVSSSSVSVAVDQPDTMLQERYATLRSIAEECIEFEELLNLLRTKPNPVCYDGFEPSGRIYAHCADWFAMLNKKMGGDLDAIRTVGLYMIEVWKSLGVKTDEVEFLWSSEEIFNRPNEYWPLVMDIAQKRCCQIMGRSEKDDLSAAQFLYPLMQCADVFFLKVDICQLGTDQRKFYPLTSILDMLPGLKEGQAKMSKSDPSSAIFMEDDESQINCKIKKAFCPINVVEGNPCLEYIKYIVLPWFGSFDVARKEANGGNKIYRGMDEVIADYSSGALHPADLKPALTKALNKILQPVRDHFNSNNEAKDLLEAVKVLMNKYKKTD
ncbi:unnamed protein product [Miscanthus lutarioriparius]|uniref:tyrosine--tRNA ligase n=1 Tax=Miscanthus lutarioriparius TaxID=422564 RepID=A0A811RSJ6_9POAL|nr:unnamed protein product [Miscanthus lutarioriparius]